MLLDLMCTGMSGGDCWIDEMGAYTFLRFYFEFSGGKRVEPSRFPPENLTQKSICSLQAVRSLCCAKLLREQRNRSIQGSARGEADIPDKGWQGKISEL
jgi:hypothetical protein